MHAQFNLVNSVPAVTGFVNTAWQNPECWNMSSRKKSQKYGVVGSSILLTFYACSNNNWQKCSSVVALDTNCVPFFTKISRDKQGNVLVDFLTLLEDAMSLELNY